MPEEVDHVLDAGGQDALLADKFREAGDKEMSSRNDFSDLVAAHANQAKRKAESRKDKDNKKKFKF